MRTLFALLLAAAASTVAAAQAPATASPPQNPASPQAPAGGPTFRSGVDLVSIEVAVVDRRGRPVEDLRAAEFSVKIDGEQRRVVSADLVKVDVEAAKKQAADRTETFFTTNMTPPNGRLIVLAIDQMNIRPGSIKPILAAASKFLDQLSPLDQVALFTYPEPGPRVTFTNDKLRLRLAMEKLIGHSPRVGASNLNIGVFEAVAITDKRDQLVLAAVIARECRSSSLQQRSQCERDVVDEASDITLRVKEDAEQSLAGLRQLLQALTRVDGPKSLILISEGLAIDNPNEIMSVAALAGRARTSINVMLVDLGRGDVTIAERPPSETQDRRIQMEGLEMLSTMALGSMFYVVGTGEPIFDRLSSEISAHYVLGVEQRPSDAKGDRHRIDVEVRRQDVTIRSRQAFVLSPTLNARLSPEDSLRDALLSPFAVSGLPLRVTTFAQQDASSDKVRLTVAAQIDQPGAQSADYTVGFLLVNDENQIVSNFGATRPLTAAGNSPNEPLHFAGGALVDPGNYSLRFGAVDAQGRRGSVVRDVAAWKMTGEELATGDLLVGGVPAPQGIRASVEPYVSSGEAVGAYLELYSTSPGIFEGTEVIFEIGDDADSPALASAPARLGPGARDSWRVATGVVAAQALPPGRYVARAYIARGGQKVGVLSRPFVLERAAGLGVAPAAATAAAVSFAGTLPKFERGMALRPELVGAMLDIVEKRSPALKDPVAEARAGRYGIAAVEALGAGDQTVASFLKGLDHFAKGQLDEAATQLHIAAGDRRDFFPAAFYLGAAFAAAGRDRDAAGIWQLALGPDPRPAEVYAMVADARLRDGQAASAIDILKPAFDRDPANIEISKRLGIAYVLTGRYVEAVPVLDAYLERQPEDQDVLLAAIVAQYETARAGQTLSNVDREKLRKYSAAYQGPQQALVDKYLTTLQVR